MSEYRYRNIFLSFKFLLEIVSSNCFKFILEWNDQKLGLTNFEKRNYYFKYKTAFFFDFIFCVKMCVCSPL